MDAQPLNLEDLLTPSTAEVRSAVPDLREKMIFEAACSLGARAGLVRRSKEIHDTLEAQAKYLDRLSFQPFMTSEGMLPPVVSEEIDTVRQEGEKNKRSAGVIYRMISEARLVSIAPTWRDYVYSGLTFDATVDMPHQSFIPTDSSEAVIWKKAVTQCWNSGIKQAEDIFYENMSRFERDYYGTIRYKMLAARGMVEGIRVGTEINATSGSRTELIIDDRHYRITNSGGLIPDSKKWK